MTSVQRINWAVLGANVGSTVLFTLLLLSPFLWGAHLAHWLFGLAIGIALGIYFDARRDRYTEPGPDTATPSQAPMPTKPGSHGDRPSLLASPNHP
jgi:hypothetical protein